MNLYLAVIYGITLLIIVVVYPFRFEPFRIKRKSIQYITLEKGKINVDVRGATLIFSNFPKNTFFLTRWNK